MTLTNSAKYLALIIYNIIYCAMCAIPFVNAFVTANTLLTGLGILLLNYIIFGVGYMFGIIGLFGVSIYFVIDMLI